VAGGQTRYLVLICVLHTSAASAYRPFDSTAASVADPAELELELGTGYQDEDDFLIIPAVVANYGVRGDREIVLEGTVVRAIDDGDDSPRTRLTDTALSLKQIHRRGVLQDAAGVSVASECGVLLPTIHGEDGVGAACKLIGSQRWAAATLHVNGGLTYERSHRWAESLGIIVEGSDERSVRPVAEVSVEWNDEHPRAALVGLIWSVDEGLSFDAGVRYSETGSVHAWEVRAGLTWSPRTSGN
jgi:hypothetical protein